MLAAIAAGVLVWFFFVNTSGAGQVPANHDASGDSGNSFSTQPNPDSKKQSTRFTGSELKGNYIYGAAMNLAWNEVNENIVHGKLEFKTDDPATLALANIFNSAPFTKEDLDEASYYIKSGFGQKTLDTINREVRAKFPDKSFADLQFRLAPKDLVSYAYFLKKVEYLTPFRALPIPFMGQYVEGFLRDKDNEEQRNNVGILSYDHDDHFIISLKLEDPADQLFLAKGFDASSPEEVVDHINQELEKTADLPIMGNNDNFQMPRISFSHGRSYDEMIGKTFANKGFENYALGGMFEKIAFDIDEKGARVENEAAIHMQSSRPVRARNFLLNKPFWIVMKRRDSRNPYFIVHIANAEFMKKTP